MILRALYDYYQRKAEDPESNIAPRGFERKEIPFIIVIDKDGHFINLDDTRSGDGPKRRAKTFLVIKTKSRTGINGWKIANTLWDHWGFVLGQARNESNKALLDAGNQNSSFIVQAKRLSEKYHANSEFQAVCMFYDLKDEIQKVLNHENWPECYKVPGCNLSFRIAGKDALIAEHPDLSHEVESEVAVEEAGQIAENSGVCLITGEKSIISVIHSATPVPGGKSGGKLVGFQKNSGYDSYYKEQGMNSPVSQKAEDAYTTALNVLLAKDSRNKFKIGDTTPELFINTQKKRVFCSLNIV